MEDWDLTAIEGPIRVNDAPEKRQSHKLKRKEYKAQVILDQSADEILQNNNNGGRRNDVFCH